ncbi:hypothetical protein Rhopal_001404-T1 [Rhodotorula paludigena]|uniref:SAC domain-containing protein n=1 Tax=Rhodotorula paludigena TaxID=86838 RepID=A0AAV5GE83_9BASI|nr:hypothetical protein Rhopal_001404-T1 [Rhodotorula paludigena]
MLAADPDGLILRPFDASYRAAYDGAAVRIRWGGSSPEPLARWVEQQDDDGIEVDGVAGVLTGFVDSYLVVITQATVAATLPESPPSTVFTAQSLLAVPLGSIDAAQAVITRYAAKQAARRKRSTSTTSTANAISRSVDAVVSASARLATPSAPVSAETTDESDTDSDSSADEADAEPPALPAKGKRPFWQRTFSRGFGRKSASTAPDAVSEVAGAEREALGESKDMAAASNDPNEASPLSATNASNLPDIAAAATSAPATARTSATDELEDADVRESQLALDKKLVAECIRTFTGLYFSYGGDITRSLQAKHQRGEESTLKHLPAWRSAEKRFWFNRHLISPFVQAGLHAYVLVLQQGFCQQVTVNLPLRPYSTLTPSAVPPSPTSVTLDLILLTRRSTERPGLRYQRRGINDSGQVANFCESEFIVVCEREGRRHVASFVQIRGSIPVFWSQSPWALKPPPVLERTKEESRAAMAKHFDALLQRYGRVVCVNLAEVTGKEGAVVEAYRTGVASLKKDEKDLRYVDFDFHAATKGFHYENLSRLIDLVEEDLEELQTFWTAGSEVYSVQQGVLRQNCIDCLDRTNVSMSAVARWVLQRHLVHLGITTAGEDAFELETAFNALWADNGDAISREYAGTSALKGDFTRTGKRNWRGAMNDASNSISRLLLSTTTDFFKQATLDYVLGVNLRAFEEFSARLEASDPGEIVRLAKIRQEAIETTCREALPEGEHKLAAWTLLSPSAQDCVRPPKGGKFEEKVFILSSRAIYVVAYEYTLQKVISSLRVPLGSVAGVQVGAYHLSALDASGRDANENYGFCLRFYEDEATEHVRTYSLRTSSPRKAASTGSSRPATPLKPLKLPFSAGKMTSSSSSSSLSGSAAPSTPASPPHETHYIAFKALRRDAVKLATAEGESQILDSRIGGPGAGSDTEGRTAREIVWNLVARVREECGQAGADVEREGWCEERDVISLAESKAQTSIVDKLSHSLYKAIWL